jgi:hypothetical protein
MGFFDRFSRCRPNPEQDARLASITNPQQRAALPKAIADGDVIPEYAWEPLPTEFDTVALLRKARPAAGSSQMHAVSRSGITKGAPSSHRGWPVVAPPTRPVASRATACAPTPCRSRSWALDTEKRPEPRKSLYLTFSYSALPR